MKKILGTLTAILFLTNCATVSKKNEERAQMQMQLGIGYLQSQKYPEALTAIQEALKLNNQDYQIHNNLGLAYYGLSKWQKAKYHFEVAIQLKKDFPQGLNNLCSTYNQLGEYEKAIEACKQALAIDTYATPEFARTNLGISLTQLRRYREAQNNFEVALKKRPQFCQAIKEFGKMEYDQKNFKDAVSKFKQVLKLCPMHQESHYRLGLSFFYLGEKRKSARVFQEFVQKFPNSDYSKPTRQYLKLLTKK